MLDKIMPFLEVSHLRKSFVSPDGGKSLVVDVENFSLSAGDLFGMRGESGSGKTTFLHLLAGILRPDEGSVILDGIEVSKLSEADRDHLRASAIGYVFQSFNLLPTLDSYENIVLPIRLSGAKVDDTWVDRIIGVVGLEGRVRHRPSELSGGQQQRVAVARALASRPQVVFADEPTGDLDRHAGHEVLTFLRGAVDDFATTVVMVTHDAAAASFADDVLFLADGRIVDRLSGPTVDGVLDRMKALEV